MSTYKELIYMANDLVKNLSDDAVYTEEHIAFLLNKYRMHILKQKYEKSLLSVSPANVQTISIGLQEVNTIPGCSAEGCLDDVNVIYARSKTKVPYTMDLYTSDITVAKVKDTNYSLSLDTAVTFEDIAVINSILGEGALTTSDIGKKNVTIYETTCSAEISEMYDLLTKKYGYHITKTGNAVSCAEERVNAIQNYSNVSVVSKYRIGYTGYGRYVRKAAYATIGADSYLYVKFTTEDFKGYNRAYLTGVFEDPDKAYECSECNVGPCGSDSSENHCEPWDNRFPMEEAYVPQLLALVVKELIGASWRPRDGKNDSMDSLSELAAFIQRNLRSNVQKQMSGDEL